MEGEVTPTDELRECVRDQRKDISALTAERDQLRAEIDASHVRATMDAEEMSGLCEQLTKERDAALEQVRLANIDWANAETVMDAQDSELARLRPVFSAACGLADFPALSPELKTGVYFEFLLDDVAAAVDAARKVTP